MSTTFNRVAASALVATASILCVAAGCSKSTETGTPEPREAPRAATAIRQGGGHANVAAPEELNQRMPRFSSSPGPMLWLEPGDLITSSGQTPIRAYLDNGGDTIDEALVSAVANELELRTYPELTPVMAEVKTYIPPKRLPATDTPEKGLPPTQPKVADHDRAYIELHPKAPLASAWHVLSMKKLPAGIRPAPWSAPQPPVGAYAARFHPGSQPVLVRVLFCEKKTAMKAIFEFSENVKVSPEVLAAAATVEQGGKLCSYVGSGPTPASSLRWVDELCDGFSKTGAVRVRLNSGLASQAGVPVTTFDGADSVDMTVDVSSLPDGSNGCKVLRL